jgi:hypothetical protein
LPRRFAPHNDEKTPSAVIARLDRAIQYAAASRFYLAASGILDPRLRGDDSGGRFSLSDANELEQQGG